MPCVPERSPDRLSRLPENAETLAESGSFAVADWFYLGESIQFLRLCKNISSLEDRPQTLPESAVAIGYAVVVKILVAELLGTILQICV